MKRFILSLTILLAGCSSSPTPPAVVLPVMIATDSAFIDPSYPSAEVQLAEPNQVMNGIEVRMARVSVEGKSINADVCFTLPDASDWSILNASLNYGGVVVQEFGTTLASLQDPASWSTGLRCDTLTFVVPPDADLSNVTIAIDAIGAIPREGEYCSMYMPKIQASLLERNIAIALDCVDVNGALAMQIISIPPEMTQEQAEEIVYSDEFYTVLGPWSFSFNLSQ